MTVPVPATMRALEVRNHQGGAASLALTQLAVPTPAPGEVLVRVHAAPINPNDLLFLRDAYEVKKPLPAVAGFEGSGTVVAAGGGLMARALVGRRVACVAGEGGGTWAEYMVTRADRCVPLRRAVTDEQGATMLTNPMTAWVLLAGARREGHRAIVQAAAAGALGQMLARLARAEGVPVVNVVRGAAQVAAMRALGAEHVIDSTDAGFDAALAETCRALGATLALDPIGGEMTGRLARALADGGCVRVYGSLSGEPARVDVDELVFRGKRVEGFTMYRWIARTSMIGQVRTAMAVQGRLGDALRTEVRDRVPLEAFREALGAYEQKMSGGKILFVPSSTAGARA